VADSKTVWGLYKDGCTIQVHQPQRFQNDLAEVCSGLEQRLGCLVGINAYLTPPGTQVSTIPSLPKLAFALESALAFELSVALARVLAFGLALAPEFYPCPLSSCLVPCSVPCQILPLTCQVLSCCSGLYNLVTCCLKTHQDTKPSHQGPTRVAATRGAIAFDWGKSHLQYCEHIGQLSMLFIGLCPL